jgi:DNA-binding MarR family transcriptional regulator
MAEINKIIHERARLLILTFLAKNEEIQVSFSDLKNELNMSAGNLSAQLSKLKDANFIQIDKRFKNNRPLTSVVVTSEGLGALNNYFDEIEKMIRSLRK